MAKTAPTSKLPPVDQLRGRPVGRILIKMGALSRDKVHECLKIQKQKGGGIKLGEVMIEQGLIDQEQLQMALAAQKGMEYVNIKGLSIDAEVIEKVPAQMATGYRIVPIEFDASANELIVALDDAENFRATDDLSTLMGFKVRAKVTDKDALEEALNAYYATSDSSGGGEFFR